MTHRGPFQPLLFCDSVMVDLFQLLTGENEFPPKKVTRYQVAMKTHCAANPGNSGKYCAMSLLALSKMGCSVLSR